MKTVLIQPIFVADTVHTIFCQLQHSSSFAAPKQAKLSG
jgi:hypothetical protein